jgi:hypothetical protein
MNKQKMKIFVFIMCLILITEIKSAQVSTPAQTVTPICPFVNYPPIPTIAAVSAVPEDPTNFTAFSTNFNTVVIPKLNTYATNYSAAVKSWSSNQIMQTLKNLITTMNSATVQYTNYKNQHIGQIDMAINQIQEANEQIQEANQHGYNYPPPPFQPSGPGGLVTDAFGTNAILASYVNAANALYDSYAAILEFLNQYNLAPAWATFNPSSSGPKVTRSLLSVGGCPCASQQQQCPQCPQCPPCPPPPPCPPCSSQGGNQVLTVPAGDGTQVKLQLNKIQGFVATDLVKAINNAIQAFQTCYNTTIPQLTTSIKQAISNANNVKSEIQRVAHMPQIQAYYNQPHNQRPIQVPSTIGLTIGLATAPDLTAFSTVIDTLAQVFNQNIDPTLLQDTEFLNRISAQLSNNMVQNWGSAMLDFSNANLTSVQGLKNLGEGLENTAKGVFDFAASMAVGLETLVVTTGAVAEAIFAGKVGGPQEFDQFISAFKSIGNEVAGTIIGGIESVGSAMSRGW